MLSSEDIELWVSQVQRYRRAGWVLDCPFNMLLNPGSSTSGLYHTTQPRKLKPFAISAMNIKTPQLNIGDCFFKKYTSSGLIVYRCCLGRLEWRGRRYGSNFYSDVLMVYLTFINSCFVAHWDGHYGISAYETAVITITNGASSI